MEPGTTGEDFAREEYPQAELLPYGDPQAAFAALRSREIDDYLHDAPTSWNLARSAQDGDLLSLYRPLTRERLAWAVKKGNSKLQRQLNGALAELRANGGLEAIRRRWIPVTVEIR